MKGAKRLTRRLCLLLSACIIAIGLAVAAAPGLANAKPAAPVHASAHRSVGASPTPAQMAHVTQASVTTNYASAAATAGDPCFTISRQENANDEFGITLFWFKMQTSWCWDYRTVTRHTTRIYWGVTGTGDAVGWAYINNSGIYFDCYIAPGSTRQCSGNNEDATASFLNLFTMQACLPYISMSETYRGQFVTAGYPC